MAFPFSSTRISKFFYDPKRKCFCFLLFKIPFKAYLGRDSIDNHKLLEDIINGEIKLCTSQIKLEKGKIFWLAVVEIQKDNNQLKPEIIAEASLSLEYPLVVKVGKSRLSIGTKEEFLYRRLAIQASRKRIQTGVTYAKSGKGRSRKLKALEKMSQLERNYVHNRLHIYSRKLIDFCINNKAGTLILLDQEEKMELAKEEEFVLRNWSYYKLMAKIKYKANKAGIELITA